MAQPQRVSIAEAEVILGNIYVAEIALEHGGQLAIQLQKKLKSMKPTAQGSYPLHAASTEQILSRMKEQLSTSYASTGSVCSWERYRKIVKLNPTSVLFESHFPGSHVHTWPTNPTAQYWFASNLRNSIAHGQIYIIDNLVTLYNINKKGVADFEFTMPAQKFGNLMRGCLETLLANVGPPEWRITAPKLYDIKNLYNW